MCESIRTSLHYRKVTSVTNFDALTKLFAKKNYPSILGANSAQCEDNRFSVWAAEPREIFIFDASEENLFDKLQSVLGKYSLDKKSRNPLPQGMFYGGWIGYFSYDLARYIEKIPQTAVDDIGLPLIRLCFYDRAICYDHQNKDTFLIALQLPDDNESTDQKLAGLLQLLKESENIDVDIQKPVDICEVDISNLRCNMKRQDYFSALEKIHQYIYDGDVYQINFSQRFDCDYTADPVDLFCWLNLHNPSPFSAYIAADDFAIVSASPEMFIKVDNGVISTKPIKGTRPRMCGKEESQRINEKNFTDLVESIKDQAELNMIVDLERNDLARICIPGTRHVSQPRTIEAFPTVFHAFSTIEGKLRNPDSPSIFCDVLKAVFPGGSITGAPKIRAMEIIDELEPTQRGVYTGSIGFLGINGSVCLNIAIRTVIIRDNIAYAQTGGGIVADSDPVSEWDETITKARALLAGIAEVEKNTLQL